MQSFFKDKWTAVGLAVFGLSLQLLVVPLVGQTNGISKLTVRVTGTHNAKGLLRIALFQDAKGFPENSSEAFRVQQAEIDPRRLGADVVFDGIPQRIYAVSIFHDENMNGVLDKFLGAPKEGYGTSNNPQEKMGCSIHAYMPPYQCMEKPTFGEAKVRVDGPEHTVEIKLIY